MYELRFLIDTYRKRQDDSLRRFLLRRIDSRPTDEERDVALEFVEEELARPEALVAAALSLSRMKLKESVLRSRFGGATGQTGWASVLAEGSRGPANDLDVTLARARPSVAKVEELLAPVIEGALLWLDTDLKASDRPLYGLSCLPCKDLGEVFQRHLKTDYAVPSLYALVRRRPTGGDLGQIILAVRGHQGKPFGPELVRQLSGTPEPEAFSTLVDLARSPAVEMVRASAVALEGFAHLDFVKVAEILAVHDDMFVRLNLAESLGRIGRPEGHSLLRDLFHRAESDFLRYHCVRAAGAVGGADAVALLREGLATTSGTVRSAALEGLALNGLEPDLTQKVASRSLTAPIPDLLLTAHLTLAAGDREQGLSALLDLLGREDEASQQVALRGLSYFRDERVISPVGAFTSSSTSQELVTLAVEVLGRQRGDTRAATMLMPLLQGSNDEIRVSAIRGLGKVVTGTERALYVAVRMGHLLRDEKSARVKCQMVRTLAEMGRHTATEVGKALSEVLSTDPDLSVKKEAILGAEFLTEVPEDSIVYGMVNIHPEVQAALARVLWCHGNPEATRLLERLMIEGSPARREAAYETLQAIGMELSMLGACPGLAKLARRLLPQRQTLKTPTITPTITPGGG